MWQTMRSITAPRDEQGASAVEYGLLVSLIAAVITVAVFAFGTLVQDSFKGTCSTIKGSSSPQISVTSTC